MIFRDAKDHAESRNLLFACAITDLQAEQTTTRRENFMSLKLPAHRAPDALTSRAPAGVSLIGTHKNLQPCRLPNLFSYQTSSSLENRRWSSVVGHRPKPKPRKFQQSA